VSDVFLKMIKLDIAELEKAYRGLRKGGAGEPPARTRPANGSTESALVCDAGRRRVACDARPTNRAVGPRAQAFLRERDERAGRAGGDAMRMRPRAFGIIGPIRRGARATRAATQVRAQPKPKALEV